MKSFSYLLSPVVKKELETIEINRAKQLIEIVPPKKDIRIRYDSLIDIISCSLRLSGKSALNREIISVLRDKKATRLSGDIVAIKKAHDYLRYFLFLTEEKIESPRILQLLKTIQGDKKIDKQKVEAISEFINTNPEHPIVQAALAFILISQDLPQDNDNIKLSTIVSKGFLYNHGYDFRGMLNLEEFFISDLMNLGKKIKDAHDSGNLSSFIEYYIQALSIQSEKTIRLLRTKKTEEKTPDIFFKLSERQMRILPLFDIPNAKITNRNVQKEFGVSQITASRDLAKLSSLGLIYQKGRGRSVYYVKA